jgi:hypothetical protein
MRALQRRRSAHPPPARPNARTQSSHALQARHITKRKLPQGQTTRSWMAARGRPSRKVTGVINTRNPKPRSESRKSAVPDRRSQPVSYQIGRCRWMAAFAALPLYDSLQTGHTGAVKIWHWRLILHGTDCARSMMVRPSSSGERNLTGTAHRSCGRTATCPLRATP